MSELRGKLILTGPKMMKLLKNFQRILKKLMKLRMKRKITRMRVR